MSYMYTVATSRICCQCQSGDEAVMGEITDTFDFLWAAWIYIDTLREVLGAASVQLHIYTLIALSNMSAQARRAGVMMVS